MKESLPHDPHHRRVPVVLEDPRSAHELTAAENADLCSGCVKCCTYITVEIDVPRQSWEYDQWIWALYHGGISLYVEKPERWFLHIETVCRQLDSRSRCSIHGRHPVLCREYDPRSCERRLPLATIRAWFDDGDALESWLERERPVHWKRLMAYRRGGPAAPAPARGAAGELIRITPPGALVAPSPKGR